MDDIEIVREPSEMKTVPKSEDDKESVENFQKFIYDLFEKNGILNDLRAYLRRHIVDVLKSSHAGDTPVCQKHFSQRLELKTQAMNILIAEYLLNLEFSYTLSVFVSEIPLANMVFDFANSLMKSDTKGNLYFRDKDIWSIINYLGIKCDSTVISNIIDMYKNEKGEPLLLCIIKNLSNSPKESTYIDMVTSSEEIPFSDHSSDTLSEKSKKCSKISSKCYHYAICKSCHNKLVQLKKKLKKNTEKKEASHAPMNVNSMMKNIDTIEGGLINEMFDQLKSVYEAELAMVRAQQERRVQQTLLDHARRLKEQRQEMEDEFKARKEELENGVRAKKKFLWGLAQSLRTQHEQLARAMLTVRFHSHRLKTKEDSLQAHLVEVEQLLKTRGEDIQAQISHELVALESQLESVKREREAVNKEKAELEQLRNQITTSHAEIDVDEIEAVSDVAWSNYDVLKHEISILRKYMTTSREELKPGLDVSTLTAENAQSAKSPEPLNNEQEKKVVREDEYKLKNNQLINDFKKQKNVNFIMGNVEEMCVERERNFSPVADQSRAEEGLIQLKMENERLKEHARQQEEQARRLGAVAAGLRAQLATARAPPPPPPPPPRPRTAPPAGSTNEFPSTNKLGWRCKGAGEETTLLTTVLPPRVFIPGETVPFIGLLHDRHADSKRLMNQWRAARRASPLRARGLPPRSAPPAAPDRAHTYPDEDNSGAENENEKLSNNQGEVDAMNLDSDVTKERAQRQRRAGARGPPSPSSSPPPPAYSPAPAPRAKSPKSVLREAKEKLRTNHNSKNYAPQSTTSERDDKSPATVLREAKMRLRKLEIEAKAAEKSYMDYRKRQNQLRSEREHAAPIKEEAIVTKDIGDLTTKLKSSFRKIHETLNLDPVPIMVDTQNTTKTDYHSFIREYNDKLTMNENKFANKNTTAVKVKPIPKAFSPCWPENAEKRNIETKNYLETPLAEFRKYYNGGTTTTNTAVSDTNHDRAKTPQTINYFQTLQDGDNNTDTHNEEQSSNTLYDDVKELEAKKFALMKAKNSKKFELEILKQNITKMYNILDDGNCNKDERKVTQDVNGDEIQLLPQEKDTDETNLMRIEGETNIMRIEGENKKEKTIAEFDPIDLEVKSTAADSDAEENEKMCGNMTILISPKRSAIHSEYNNNSPHCKRSMSPEQAAKLTRNDVLEAIFHADPNKVSSNYGLVEEAFKGNDSEGEAAKDMGDDYPDDFSADVDNYDHSRTGNSSPISLAQSPEDTYWEDSQTYP